MDNKVMKLGKNLALSLIIPVTVYIVLKILCVAFGDSEFAEGSDLSTIIYTAIYTSMIALGMSFNLFSGRFDFSAGATIVLSTILGGNIAKSFEMNSIGLFVTIVGIGMILGLISGLVYVIMKLPPMITSLGLAMIFESITLIYNKSQGVRLIGKIKVLIFASQPYLWLLLLAVMMVCIYLFRFTKFGYDHQALASGQKIAIDIGIKEKRNAIGCYILAGALFGIAGCIYLSKYGTVSPEAGLSSSSYFMGAFLPLFIGGFVGKYSNTIIGIVIGAFTSAMLSSGLVALGLGTSMQTVINGLCVMGFLIFTSNSYKFELRKIHKAKLEEAIKADHS
jgi:ribose transport system permease protein